MQVLEEITVWPDGTKNHTYLVDEKAGKMLAYRRSGDGKIEVFNKPMNFYKSYRKFNKVVDNELIRLYNSIKK